MNVKNIPLPRRSRSLLASACLLATLSPYSLANPPPVEHFSRLPSLQMPDLSPAGDQMAYVINSLDPELSMLATMNLQTNKANYLLRLENTQARVNWLKWANNDYLLVSVRYAAKRHGTDTTETRLYSIKADGSEELKLLVKPRATFGGREHLSQIQDTVIHTLPNEPDHILMALDAESANMPSVYKVNIHNGRKSRVEKERLSIRDWITDQQGRVRIGQALSYNRGDAAIYHKGLGKKDKWEPIFKYNAFEDPDITPLGFGADPNVLFYIAYQDDKKALFKMDLTSQEKTLVFADPERDVEGYLIRSPKSQDVVGLYHIGFEKGYQYWKSDQADLQKVVEVTFPKMSNTLVDFSRDENVYLLYSENDDVPGTYYLGDKKLGKLRVIGRTYPELQSQPLVQHELITYKTRDGVEIEAYLSLPRDTEGPVPTLVFPHGGPHAREYGGFDYWTAYLTSRGYAVLRPNFRGSSGYGRAFAEAQMQGWGLQMQDDLTDAAHWLVSEGIAQKDRMCIIGGSYGGYAALMAATKTPDLFKCAVSFAGVSNLKQLVDESHDYVSSKFVKQQIGSKSADLKSRSPYYQVENIQIPLFIAHGEMDRVVDVEQSRRMVKELQDHKKSVEYLELADGDHFLSVQENRHAFFRKLDQFLAENLSLP